MGKKDVYQGLAKFLKVLPAVIKKRAMEQSVSKVKDEKIINKFLI